MCSTVWHAPRYERPFMIAAEIMTKKPRTICQSEPIVDAVDALQSLHVRHLPVLDDEGDLVGMLSDRDLGSLMRTFDGEDDDADGGGTRLVSDFMSSDVISISPDTPLNAVIEMMLEERIGAIPVVDGEGSVVGIISYVDILRNLGPLADSTEAEERGRPQSSVTQQRKGRRPTQTSRGAAKASR